jgi:hypothetical protein
MSSFNLPNGWEVSPAESWVSSSPLEDNGLPQLGDPSFSEESYCECDTKSFADESGGGMRLPNPERENRIITALNPKTGKRERVTQCPPGFKQENEDAPITTCIPATIEGKAGLKARAQLMASKGGLNKTKDIGGKADGQVARLSKLKGGSSLEDLASARSGVKG